MWMWLQHHSDLKGLVSKETVALHWLEEEHKNLALQMS